MIFERLKKNIRLLEQLTVFSSSQDEIPGLIPGTAEYLFLSVLKQLQRSNLNAAQHQYQQLCDLLGVRVGEGDGQLEPLRTLLHLKLWEGSEQEKHKLQLFLIKQLGLNFEAEPPVPPPPTTPGTVGDASPPAPAIAAQPSTLQPQLPSHLMAEQYSAAAFQALLDQAGIASGQSLTSMFDQSCLVEAVADESLPLLERAALLQQGLVSPALLPVQLLVGLVQAWLATESWNNTPATDWVTESWPALTTDQAMALRAVLPGPAFGFNPKIDRPYIAALVTKALAGPAATAVSGAATGGAAAAAGGGGGGGGVSQGSGVPPWSCRAADAAAAADLGRVLQVCSQLGGPADWVKVHALHAQLQLQLKSQPCVDMQLLVTFMQLLGRATWSAGPTVTDNRFGVGLTGQQPPFGVPAGQQGGQQQQQPLHVPCSVCGMRPIIGPRLRSRSQFGFNVCMGCAGSQEAVAAGPLEEVKHDDSIYMLPHVPLPDVLGEISSSEAERQALARKLLLGLVQYGVGGLFSPDGPCPLAAAGLLLPQDWRDAAVAEGKLLSGKGDTAAWSRVYQKHGDVAKLAARTELSFAPHNRSCYALGEEVTLHLDTKNVGPQGVLVKVYELNTWNYFTSEGKEVDLSLELSGLTPSRTLALKTPEDPVIRTRHSIPLGLSGTPGVWLVEAVASGQLVRARIMKGSLRLTQRPSAAGQVLTIMDEDWQPVKGVRVWCEGKEYAASPTRRPDQVLLPYAMREKATPLVVAARLEAAAEPGNECVVLFPEFERLPELYSLKAQLFCHQESLLPGQTVPLLLQLALQLHGRPAPLQLLQEVQLRLRATTHEGADVTEVFKELPLDPYTCQLQLPYSLPQGATSLSAVLTARLLLTLPGTNGEPAWQEFVLTHILPGQSGQQASIEINTAAQTDAIWDLFFTNATATAGGAHDSSNSSSSSAAPPESEYVLQVLGRSGEAPAVPKILSVWLNHVGFNPGRKLHFRVQTGPGGVVRLGRLGGIRQIEAQIEAGVSSVQTEGLAAGDQGSGPSGGKGPVRHWQVARASWWQGGLQHEYTVPIGGMLELPIRPAAGQSLTAKLLQLVEPGKSSSSFDCCEPASAAVHADISSSHLEIIPAAGPGDAATGSSSSGSGGSSDCLGCAGLITLRVQGLAAGLYRLVVPALLLEPPIEAFVGPGWSSSVEDSAITIHVLPSTAAAATAAAAGNHEAAAAEVRGAAGTEAAAPPAAAAAAEQQPWLWASAMGYLPGPAVLQPSPRQQLHIASVSCSVDAGLALQLAGFRAEQLASVQIVAVLSRFLADGTVAAAQLLQNKLPWGATGYGVEGFGFSQGLRAQADIYGIGSGNEQGLGFGAAPQPCGDYGRCSYSSAAKLDSAVAYVLQRRQWEEEAAVSGLRRPGSLLQRPSLLVMPHSVRSAASGTSVLRGGDGGRVQELSHYRAARHTFSKEKAAGFGSGGPMLPSPAFAASACAAAPCAFGMAQPQCSFARMPVCFNQQQQFQVQPAVAQTPVLGFLKTPAVVLAGLEISDDGSLLLPAEQLQLLLADAAAAAAALPAIGASGSGEGASSSSGSGSDGSSLLGPGGFAVLHVAAFVLQQPGQFASCVVAVQGAAAPEAATQPGGRRDMGQADVDDDAVCALTCDVVPLLPGDSLALPSSDACEAAVYGSSQQLYALLSGLLELAETDGVPGLASGWAGPGGGALRSLLPRPAVPPKAGGSSARSLLRQWEPLLLDWHDLATASRLELLDKLGSAELSFYLACRDRPVYEQLVLPLLRSKLPSELCCLEQVLLLQANHSQPPIPGPAAATTGSTTGAAAAGCAELTAYDAARSALLQHWYEPHRHQQLTVLEQLLLAALEGHAALLQFAGDMRHKLETAEQKRGAKKTWMAADRRALFDFALLVYRQLEQQEQQRQRQQRRATAEGSGDDTEGEGGAAADEDTGRSDDFVHVAHDDAMAGGQSMFAAIPLGGVLFGGPPAAASLPPGAPVPQAMMDSAVVPKKQKLHDPWCMDTAADLAARQQLAAAAASAAHLAPKETQECGEAGWWKCEGQHAPAALIPPALFWADFATHLATHPEQPFIPADPTGTAASTAAITAALAVIGLPCKGAPAATAAAAAGGAVGHAGSASGARVIGCSRSYAGSTLTLTARSACLLWVKQVKAVASISATASAAAAGAAHAGIGEAAAAGALQLSSSSSSATTVMVAERLFDPRFATTTDPETGEQLLLSLQPSVQQPLLAGQAYCHSLVITSTGPSEQQLDILVQLPQGALPLAGSPATTSISISLAPYATKQLTAKFYFPEPGVFKRAPVSVTKRGRPAWLPPSTPTSLHVSAQPLPGAAAQTQGSAHSEFNWSHFLASSNPAQILEYLRSGDLSRAQLAHLSPYCRDVGFFRSAVAALSRRHVCEYAVWKWAVAHMDGPALRQLLPLTGMGRRTASFGVVLPGVFLLPLSAGDVGLRHLEYWPWVNPYCRPIPRADGGDASLPSVLEDNPSIAAQWRSFLLATLFDPNPSSSDSSNSTSTTSSSSGTGSSGGSGLGLVRAAAAACYLLLQDRIDDAEAVLAGADLEQEAAAGLQEGSPLRMQVDYLRAWMALQKPLPTAKVIGALQLDAALAVAKSVVSRYADVAAQPWSKRFAQLSAMVTEVEQQLAGGPGFSQPAAAAPAAAAALGTASGSATAAAAGAMLSVLGCEGSKLRLMHRGISELTLSAYHIDTELLFTNQPFSSLSTAAAAGAAAPPYGGACGGAGAVAGSDGNAAGFAGASGDAGLGKVAFVQPSVKVVLQLPLPAGTHGAVPVPAAAAAAASGAAGSAAECCVLDLDVLMPQLASQSVLLQVAGGGVSRTLPRFASMLSVHVFESQGVLQACYNSAADGRQVPAAAVYVKVFARDSSSNAWFYKDGYTDVRGKFDYVTLTSTADMSRVMRYSLLAASPGLGSIMVQVAPPPK